MAFSSALSERCYVFHYVADSEAAPFALKMRAAAALAKKGKADQNPPRPLYGS
jgi:hypothetical protein